MSRTPPLSVVMPVRNALRFLDESVSSILAQSFADFEFVILDDASDDGSAERLRTWADRDRRIRLIESGRRLGPVGSSQAVAEAALAPLVARMDADDVALPERLQRQVEVFAAEAGAGLVGTLHELIDEQGRLIRGRELAPLAAPRPVVPVTHSSIMYRRDVWRQIGGYRPGHDYWEDIDLYLRFAEAAEIYVVPEALCRVRFSRTSVRSTAARDSIERAYDKMHRRLTGTRGREERILPEAFLTMAAPLLWSGVKPSILGGLLRRGALARDRKTLRALLWALWAELSPASLAVALSGAARLRERRAPADLGAARWLRWEPMRPTRPSGSAQPTRLKSSRSAPRAAASGSAPTASGSLSHQRTGRE